MREMNLVAKSGDEVERIAGLEPNRTGMPPLISPRDKPLTVVIVGPVKPFQTGIARHTTAVAQEMAGRPDVNISVISFSRQYPQFLYPGKNQRSLDGEMADELDVEYCLDSVNPWSWMAVISKILRRQPGLVVIPAWTFVLAPCLGYISRALRRHNVPVIMIAHNAADHEEASWKSFLYRFQLRNASAFVTHNTPIAKGLKQIVPDIPVSIQPHPIYDDYPAPRGDLKRDAALELLFFGLVRKYKGLDILLKALAAAKLNDVRLSIVGEFWTGRAKTEALIRDLGLTSKVELFPRHVSDQEAAEFFARCDVVVAPYLSASGSGVIALAQWTGRPVLASDVPELAEAVNNGSVGWTFPTGDVDALAQLLATEVSRESAIAMHPAIEKAREKLTWAQFVDVILNCLPSAPMEPISGIA